MALKEQKTNVTYAAKRLSRWSFAHGAIPEHTAIKSRRYRPRTLLNNPARQRPMEQPPQYRHLFLSSGANQGRRNAVTSMTKGKRAENMAQSVSATLSVGSTCCRHWGRENNVVGGDSGHRSRAYPSALHGE